MTIRIQYRDDVYDIVSAITLHRLLEEGKIKKFYRYSEKKWVVVGVDPIRRPINFGAPPWSAYEGPERRATQSFGELAFS